MTTIELHFMTCIYLFFLTTRSSSPDISILVFTFIQIHIADIEHFEWTMTLQTVDKLPEQLVNFHASDYLNFIFQILKVLWIPSACMVKIDIRLYYKRTVATYGSWENRKIPPPSKKFWLTLIHLMISCP